MQPALQRTFLTHASRLRADSPLYAALCESLAAGRHRTAGDLFGRYFRILSTDVADVSLFLGALHHLALTGSSAALAALFPSCGGKWDGSGPGALLAAVEDAMASHYDEILDFMLSQERVTDDPAPAALFLLGALAAAERFGGDIALVEMGAGGGLHLLLDQYAYRFGAAAVGDGPLRLELKTEGPVESLLCRGIPTVRERVGLEARPRDLTRPDGLLLSTAFVPPDRLERIERLRTGAAVMARAGRPDLREGQAASDLAAVAEEVYDRMEPGTTLLLVEALHWSTLGSEEQKQVAHAIQRLAARIRPEKPIAWFQADRFAPGDSALELRLHTFGWTDPEDRAVRRIGAADPHLTWVRLES